MRPKTTWKNLLILVGVLPVRVPLLALCGLVQVLGHLAQRIGHWAGTNLPGLEFEGNPTTTDWPSKHIEEMFKLTQRRAQTDQRSSPAGE